MSLTNSFEPIVEQITINAPVSAVWQSLTDPVLMKKWMLDAGAELEIITDWKVGHAIIMKGKLHDVSFENKGKVLVLEKEKKLAYSHLSSISDLPELDE